MPLTTSSTTSASRASPRRTAHAARGKTVVREPMWCSSSPGAGRDDRLGAVVRARDDRHAVAPLQPIGDLTEQVRARSAALRVGPIAVGQEQDVLHRGHDRSRWTGLDWPAHAVRSASEVRARRRRGGARPAPRHRVRAGRGRRPVLRPVRLGQRGAGAADRDAARPRRHAPHPRQPAPTAAPPGQPAPAATAAPPTGPTLPYTGVDGWLVAGGGALLLGAGLTLRARLREPD